MVCLAVSACAPVRSLRGLFDPDARMASGVTITRDSWGVPYIDAETDAGVVFGVAYAQAEDNFWQIEEDYINALGLAASVYGETAIDNDLVRAGFEVTRLAREEYEREPPERRALWDAWAAGLNFYLSTHPEVERRAIRRFEPWHPFALARAAWASTVVDSVPLRNIVAIPVGAATTGDGIDDADHIEWSPPTSTYLSAEPIASNAWAIAPSRTRDGKALLFLNPHVDFFGNGQRWEMSVRSGTGWHVAGFAVLGMPVPHSGFNERLGWTHTSTGADVADAYIESFDHESDPLSYRAGEEWLRASEYEADILVRTNSGLESRRYRFMRTHRGPVAALQDGRRASIRIARFAEGGALQQWLAMGKALTFDEFRDALAQTALPGSNTMYADRDGNIHYLHGNAIPRRDPSFDWRRPVSGSDNATEWQGYHLPDELPHVTNPAAGWIQNTNSSPFQATAEGSNPDAGDYPAYMSAEPDNARARASRRLLEVEEPWTFERLQAAAFDTYVLEAEEAIPRIVDEWERLGAYDPDRAGRLDHAVQLLRSWERFSGIGSTAMTLFVDWSRRMAQPGALSGEWPNLRALESTVASITERWGTLDVAWGHVNRLQRVHTSGVEPFDSLAPSLPVPGGPGALGLIFDFGTRTGPDGRQYGVRGHSWVGVVEFGDTVRARSIMTFGQSADPLSPHWFDQAPLYARGQLKPLWFTQEDIEANRSIRYHPGDRMQAYETGGR